jgi:hypothetical protein
MDEATGSRSLKRRGWGCRGLDSAARVTMAERLSMEVGTGALPAA